MMEINPAAMETYIGLAGLVVTIVGFMFVIVQVRQLERSVRSAAHSAIYAQAADYRAHLVAHPELRRYFFDGVDIDKAHTDYARVLTISELLLNYMEHLGVEGHNLDGQDRAAWEAFVRAVLRSSPVTARRLTENQVAYSPQLRRMVEQQTPL